MELLIGISREARIRVIELGKNWSHFLILGCILLLGGVLAITIPLITNFDAVKTVGWTLLACGFFQLFQSLRIYGSETFRWWLVFGAMNVLLAVAVLRNPLADKFTTVQVVTGLMFVLGVLKIVYAYRLRPTNEWTRLFLSGLVTLVLTVLIGTNLFQADSKLSTLLSIELISAGLWSTLIGWGFNTMNERLIKQVM